MSEQEQQIQALAEELVQDYHEWREAGIWYGRTGKRTGEDLSEMSFREFMSQPGIGYGTPTIEEWVDSYICDNVVFDDTEYTNSQDYGDEVTEFHKAVIEAVDEMLSEESDIP